MSEILISGVDRTSLFDSFRLRITNNKRTYNKVRGTLYAPEFTITEGEEMTIKVDTDLEFGGLLQSVINTPTTVHNAYTIYATGYEQICDRRTVAISYSDTNSGDIVTAMLALLAGEGITLGNIEDGLPVTIQKNATTISELFDELALTSGFVWFIDNDKKLYFQEDYNYTSGTFPTDYEVVEVGRSLVGYSNKVFCVGANSIVAFAEDTTEQSKMAGRFGSGVYGITIRDANADTEAKALAVAEAELKKRAFDKKYVKIKTRERLQEGTIYTNVTIPNTDIVGEDYAIDEVYIEGNGNSFTWTATLQPYDISIISKKEAWQQKFKQFLNVTNTEVSGSSGASVYVSPDEPLNAADSDLWVDTDDYSKYDVELYEESSTLLIEDGEVALGSGTITLTLFTALDHPGVVAIIKNIGTGVITIATDGSETIDGAATYSLSSQYDKVTIVSDGTNWSVI